MPSEMLFTLLAILLVIILVIRKVKGKGWAGEHTVARRLKRLPYGYIVLNDLLLPTTGQGSTQIDHIVVSEYGIFVIETKNYTGIISGSEYADSWTKNMFGRKYSMTNPVEQNQTHIRAVARILTKAGIGTNIYSIITFPKTAQVMARSERCEIVYFNQLQRTIRQHKDVQMDWDTTQKAAQALQTANITDLKSRREHTWYVKHQNKTRQLMVANLVCPKCGAELVKRNGKYGTFYGCSNYPKCKFITK